MASLTDLTEFRDHARKRLNDPDCFTMVNGIEITRMADGYAEGVLTVSDTSMDVTGCVHKGALSSLMDHVAAAAAVASGYNCVTLNCENHFLEPVRDRCLLIGEAHLVNSGDDIYTYRTAIRRGNDLIAMGTYIFYLTGALI